jgi:hypothetical protein
MELRIELADLAGYCMPAALVESWFCDYTINLGGGEGVGGVLLAGKPVSLPTTPKPVLSPKLIPFLFIDSVSCKLCFLVTLAIGTLYRKFETNITRYATAWPRSQFLHSCICEQFIYSKDRSVYFVGAK